MLDFIQLVFGFIYDLFTMLFTISLGPFTVGSLIFGLAFVGIVVNFVARLLMQDDKE